MIYDPAVSEFVAGGVGSRLPNRFAPPGLPSMSTVLADPLSSVNRTQGPVQKWKRSRMFDMANSAFMWKREDDDQEMSDDKEKALLVFNGEEAVIPDTIPDDIW